MAVTSSMPRSFSCGNGGSDDPPRLRVVRVIDGDTIWVQGSGPVEKVRLLGIDAPEMNYGKARPECGATRLSDRFADVRPGTTIGFEIDLANERFEVRRETQRYRLNVVLRGDEAIRLDQRLVEIVVPGEVEPGCSTRR